MKAKALADSLVEAGMVTKPDCAHPEFALYFFGLGSFEAENLVTDWRVRGKCLELMIEDGLAVEIKQLHDGPYVRVFKGFNELIATGNGDSAIVEAFCEARQ